jgi:hypothetical protein
MAADSNLNRNHLRVVIYFANMQQWRNYASPDQAATKCLWRWMLVWMGLLQDVARVLRQAVCNRLPLDFATR